jgi:hypothetical protein
MFRENMSWMRKSCVTELDERLAEINPNFEWRDLFLKCPTENSFYKKAQPKVVKEFYEGENISTHFYEHYVKLFMKAPTKIEILCYNKDEKNNKIPDFLSEDIKLKNNILHKYLSFTEISYKDIFDESERDYSVPLVPVCSPLFLKCHKLRNVIYDSYFNLYKTEDEKFLNKVLYKIYLMRYSKMSIDDIISSEISQILVA